MEVIVDGRRGKAVDCLIRIRAIGERSSSGASIMRSTGQTHLDLLEHWVIYLILDSQPLEPRTLPIRLLNSSGPTELTQLHMQLSSPHLRLANSLSSIKVLRTSSIPSPLRLRALPWRLIRLIRRRRLRIKTWVRIRRGTGTRWNAWRREVGLTGLLAVRLLLFLRRSSAIQRRLRCALAVRRLRRLRRRLLSAGVCLLVGRLDGEGCGIRVLGLRRLLLLLLLRVRVLGAVD